MDKPYREKFYLVTFTDDRQIFFVETKEIEDPEMAELAIPYETDDILGNNILDTQERKLR